ncbi:M48 family metalloprotease [Pseudomonadota bacterium]
MKNNTPMPNRLFINRHCRRALLIGATASALLVLGACTTLSSDEESTDGNPSFRQRMHVNVLNETTSEDIKAEINFGRDVAARVLGRTAIQKNKALNKYVSLIGTALAAHANRAELQFHFGVLDSDDINAYSTPGGYIFVTRGAVNLAENEAELAAILAHEIAHITERHIVDSLNIRATDASGAAGLGRLIGAGTDTARVAFTQAIDEAVNILFEKGYSQQHELDSDRVATLLLANAGYDPMALRQYLQRAHSVDHASESINTTHPPSRQRLMSLDRLIKEEQLDQIQQARNSARFNKYVIK